MQDLDRASDIFWMKSLNVIFTFIALKKLVPTYSFD